MTPRPCLLDHCLQRCGHLGLVRGQREVAGVFDDDQALLRSRDPVEIRLHERCRREEIVPPLDDVVGNLEAGRRGGKVPATDASIKAEPDAFIPSPIALSVTSVSPSAMYLLFRPVSQAVSDRFMCCRIGREKPKYCLTFFGSGLPMASRAASAAVSPLSL